MIRILDAIRQEHRHTAQLLDRLSEELSRFEQGQSPDFDLLLSITEFFSLFPDTAHHNMEDILYDRIVCKSNFDKSSIIDLPTEHEALNEITISLQRVVEQLELDQEVERDQVAKVIRDFISTYRQHMMKEEKHFLPFAEQSLNTKDWAEIAEVMADPNRTAAEAPGQSRVDFLHDLICNS